MIGCYLVVISFPVGCGQSYCPTCFGSNTLSPHPLHRESLQHSSTGNILHALISIHHASGYTEWEENVCMCVIVCRLKWFPTWRRHLATCCWLTILMAILTDPHYLLQRWKTLTKRCLEFTPTGCHYQLSFESNAGAEVQNSCKEQESFFIQLKCTWPTGKGLHIITIMLCLYVNTMCA